jgi:hypothetical protein
MFCPLTLEPVTFRLPSAALPLASFVPLPVAVRLTSPLEVRLLPCAWVSRTVLWELSLLLPRLDLYLLILL